MSSSLRSPRPLVGLLAAAALALPIGAGCSAAPGAVKPSPPAPVSYSVDFLNQSNAVGSALVQVSVFKLPDTVTDTTDRIAYCSELKSRRQNKQELREPDYIKLGETPLISPCDIVTAGGGDGGASPGRLEVPFGPVAVLVVAFKDASSGVLIGCGIGEVREGGEPIAIPLSTQFDRFTAFTPSPLCNRLVDRCNGVANCPPR